MTVPWSTLKASNKFRIFPSPSAPALSRPAANLTKAGMLSIARQARGPCRREALSARAALAATAVSGRQHAAAGRHLLRLLLPRSASSATPAARPSLPPPLLRSRRDRLSSEEVAAGVTSRARRGLAASSTTIRSVGSPGEAVGVREQPEELVSGGGAAVGGASEGWEVGGPEVQEGGGAFGLSEVGDIDHAEGDRFLGVEFQEEEDSASDTDAGESDADQSATPTETETKGEVEVDEVLQAQIKDPSMMRLSRRIARSGVASRREAERLVEAGVVTVNGTPVQTPALNVGPRDIVKVKVGLVVVPFDGYLKVRSGTSAPSKKQILLACLSSSTCSSSFLSALDKRQEQRCTPILCENRVSRGTVTAATM